MFNLCDFTQTGDLTASLLRVKLANHCEKSMESTHIGLLFLYFSEKGALA